MMQKYFLMLRSALVIGLLAVAPLVSAQSGRQTAQTQNKTQPTQNKTSLHVVWPGQQGVLRYRLQVARDQEFRDIVFDRAVFGTEYLIADLAPGSYYWRVAPAVKETGTFTTPRRVVITDRPTSDMAPEVRPTASSTAPPATVIDTGWRTTTGPVTLPLIAHLRSASSNDLVGVNADGMVYGLDGTNGVALWTARFRPNAKQGEPTGNGGAAPFTPVLIDGRNGTTNVIVAFDGGVRAIEGATGRELWRATLANRPISGAIASPESGGPRTLLIASDKSTLAVLNPDNGKSTGEVKLDAPVIAEGAPFPMGNGNGVIFAQRG
ncbi:MAG: PQQ-binding-like beta-propeller repeat protein [Acidobacteriota bacterium]|nr:PQQ-binding-like beta-propeller repeat protein [Acidobacteriota bacterium]